MTVALTLDANKLRKISALPTEPALREAASFLACLAGNPAFLHTWLRPLLEEAGGRMVRSLPPRRPGRLLLFAGLCLAPGLQDPQPRPLLLGSLLLRGGLREPECF
jgi:hypothetical protein